MRAEEKPLAEMTIRRYLIGLKADIPERTKRAFGNDKLHSFLRVITGGCVKLFSLVCHFC